MMDRCGLIGGVVAVPLLLLVGWLVVMSSDDMEGKASGPASLASDLL